MHLRSLGYRTDLALLQLDGSVVEDRGTHLVVRTPANPTFHWGNYLLLAHPPEPGQADHWVKTFEREFPDALHRAFGVDGAEGSVGDLAAFAELGYETDASSVMTARAVSPPARPHPTAEVRPLVSDDDWAQQVELAVEGEDEHYSVEFATRRGEAHRRNVGNGHGQWFGAFLDQRLVASMGIFTSADGLARYQEVKTHPGFRGQGLAGTLVHAAGRHALDEMGAETLVMVADPDYLAIRVYRSVGFDDTETQLGASRVRA
ncbi:GNAT family N-acetyltransferase [Nocardioides koreensis]|uniref:GNAT family N-acetyltransferase n=1 Tax=Nocardioides koreensis TaxID=433651 RepID=A0ABP5LT09_9ACTN